MEKDMNKIQTGSKSMVRGQLPLTKEIINKANLQFHFVPIFQQN